MNKKLFCFDLDNTLAPNNGPISNEVIEALKDIQAHGHQLMVITGKPTAYLAGVIRQTGLENIFISGGNGESFMVSHHYPPQKFLVNPVSDQETEVLQQLRKKIDDAFKEKVWFQPNEHQLTVFHYGVKAVSASLHELIMANVSNRFEVHQHIDCIDVLPSGFSKGDMVKATASFLDINQDQIVAIGDGENDIAMFEVAGISIGINIDAGTKRVSNITEAIKYIQGNLYE